MKSPSHNLPSYVADLLAAERQAPRPSPAAERRVRARIAASVVATAAGATTLAASGAQAAAATGMVVKTGGLAALAAKLSVVALSVGVLSTAGVVTYRHQVAVRAEGKAAKQAAVHTAAAPPRPRPMASAILAQPAEAPAVSPVAGEAPAPAVPVAAAQPASAAHASPATIPPAAALRAERQAHAAVGYSDRLPESPRNDRVSTGTLAEESSLIESARARIANGDPADALALLAQHARRFRYGQLEEEREALWVQALVQKGEPELARAAAVGFQRRFPQSIQLEIVRAAVRSIR